MRGQRVTKQYNAGRDINFGAIQTPVDLIAELEKLNGQVVQAKDAGILNEETATDAQYQVTKAIQQAKKPDPDKKTIVDHLATAKALLENITAAGGLVTALVGAVEVVQKLFS
jgi:nucleotidyltransferase/DNA polymerase involved in DNA repair